jgi:hypothetical protein
MESKKNSTTKVRGVYWSKQKSKWEVEIHQEKKKFFIGYFENFEVAVKARQLAELKHYPDIFTARV